MDQAELARRIAVYCELDLPAVPNPHEVGDRLASRLWPLISGYLTEKEMLRMLWHELRARWPDIASEISFAESGAPEAVGDDSE